MEFFSIHFEELMSETDVMKCLWAAIFIQPHKSDPLLQPNVDEECLS